MAFKPGYLGYIGLDSAAGSIVNLSPYFDNASVPIDSDTLDVSAFGTQAKSFIVGQTGGGQISLSGPYDSAAWLHIGSLISAQNAGTASHSFLWGPGGSVASQARVACEVLVGKLEPSSGVSGRAEMSVSLQITGAITASTW